MSGNADSKLESNIHLPQTVIHWIDDKESDGKYQIGKNDEENNIEDIEILKLQNYSSQKKIYILKTI